MRRADARRLLAMAAMGAVIGPVALAWGLQRTSASSASLMLTLEAVFTAVLAWRWYGETLDRRVVAAMLLLLAGGVVLVLEQGLLGQVQLLGLLAVLAATVAWGVDNTLSRGVVSVEDGAIKTREGHGKFVAREARPAVNRALSAWKDITSPRPVVRSGVPATGV